MPPPPDLDQLDPEFFKRLEPLRDQARAVAIAGLLGSLGRPAEPRLPILSWDDGWDAAVAAIVGLVLEEDA